MFHSRSKTFKRMIKESTSAKYFWQLQRRFLPMLPSRYEFPPSSLTIRPALWWWARVKPSSSNATREDTPPQRWAANNTSITPLTLRQVIYDCVTGFMASRELRSATHGWLTVPWQHSDNSQCEQGRSRHILLRCWERCRQGQTSQHCRRNRVFSRHHRTRSVKLCTRNNHSRKLCPDFSFYLGLVWDKPSSTIWTSNAMLWLTHLRQSLGGKTKSNSPIINITGSNNSIANHFFIFVLIISDWLIVFHISPLLTSLPIRPFVFWPLRNVNMANIIAGLPIN